MCPCDIDLLCGCGQIWYEYTFGHYPEDWHGNAFCVSGPNKPSTSWPFVRGIHWSPATTGGGTCCFLTGSSSWHFAVCAGSLGILVIICISASFSTTFWIIQNMLFIPWFHGMHFLDLSGNDSDMLFISWTPRTGQAQVWKKIHPQNMSP